MMPHLLLKFTRTALTAISAVGALSFISFSSAFAGELYAVVPTQIIYPGEQISDAKLETLEVTNPHLKGNFAQNVGQIIGMLSKRTLLPGHAIYLDSVREPYTVNRGTQVRLIYDNGTLKISAAGLPLQDASVGEVIRVRNADSGLTVSGTVQEDGSIKVLQR